MQKRNYNYGRAGDNEGAQPYLKLHCFLIDNIVEEMSIGLGLVKYQIYYKNLQRGRGNRVISRQKN